ncbi:UNVERIFIED_CONTAM: hypothetical protein ORM23_26685 [Bacillus cereus]
MHLHLNQEGRLDEMRNIVGEYQGNIQRGIYSGNLLRLSFDGNGRISGTINDAFNWPYKLLANVNGWYNENTGQIFLSLGPFTTIYGYILNTSDPGIVGHIDILGQSDPTIIVPGHPEWSEFAVTVVPIPR